MVIDGGMYTAKGTSGCPVVYSTVDITVKNAVGVSEQSRAVIIEKKCEDKACTDNFRSINFSSFVIGTSYLCSIRSGNGSQYRL